jgi:hypothetical protein
VLLTFFILSLYNFSFPYSATRIDISGYTVLSENMNRLYGPRGAENLAIELNKYFSLMVKTVASEGGDVFKYAGDAMIGKEMGDITRCCVCIYVSYLFYIIYY